MKKETNKRFTLIELPAEAKDWFINIKDPRGDTVTALRDSIKCEIEK